MNCHAEYAKNQDKAYFSGSNLCGFSGNSDAFCLTIHEPSSASTFLTIHFWSRQELPGLECRA